MPPIINYDVKIKRPPLKVDILIPFHGCYEHLMRCCESIIKSTRTKDYKIYVIDDCSPNKSFISKMITRRISGGQLDEQVGFGAAVGFAYQETHSPWIVIMHSDIVIKDIHWLNKLQDTMMALKDSGVKLVSARTDHPGTAASYDERIITTIDSPKKKKENFIVDTAVPLFCSLMSRDLFKEIGPLKHYPYAWYEDEELFWRMKEKGYKQAICGSSFVHHEGGATIQDLWKRNAKVRPVMEENYNRCMEDLKPIFEKSSVQSTQS